MPRFLQCWTIFNVFKEVFKIKRVIKGIDFTKNNTYNSFFIRLLITRNFSNCNPDFKPLLCITGRKVEGFLHFLCWPQAWVIYQEAGVMRSWNSVTIVAPCANYFTLHDRGKNARKCLASPPKKIGVSRLGLGCHARLLPSDCPNALITA